MDINQIRSIFRSPPVLLTERLVLRPLRLSDANDMYEYSCDCEVTKYLTWEPHKNIDFTKKQIKNILDAYRNGKYYDWALELRCNGKMIGTCGFTSFDYYEDSCEIGYVLNPRYHGYALAAEAASLVIGFAFETLGASSVWARCMTGNSASRRVMEKCGLSFEKEEIKTVVKQNRLVDALRYRISSDEYKALKQAQYRGI